MRKIFSFERALVLLPFFALFFAFLWPLIVLQKSFVLSEYAVQHLPWAWHTFNLLQKNQFPYWTHLMVCGFPLAAEGQAAPFYLPNIIGYKLLPFMAAYTWSIPLHMLLGGLGLYAYGRKLGLSRPASSLASVSYTFGSAFAGCFYYTATLKVLAWFPVSLVLLEHMRASGARKRLALMGVLAVFFALAWTAGFPQIAVYFFFYCVLHEFFIACTSHKSGKFKPIYCLTAALSLGVLLALPQVVLTTELLGQSVRKGESLGFALWGSVPPPAFVSLIFPEWGNALRVSFYVGIAPLFLVIAALFFARKDKAVQRHIFLVLFFIFLSLGRFNPIYKWAIEMFSLTTIRNPSKFLFFAAASSSILAGFGLDQLLAGVSGRQGMKAYRKFIEKFTWLTAFLPLIGEGAARFAEPFSAKYSQWYVSHLVAEKAGHAKSSTEYLKMMDNFFKNLAHLFSYRNGLNGQTIALSFLSFLTIAAFFRGRLKQNIFLACIFTLLSWDLYVFGNFLGTGFIGNAGSIDSLKTPPAAQRFLSKIKEGGGLLAELVHEPGHELFPPNANMLYGVSHAGGYSPLLLKNYYELTYELGIVDGSLGRAPSSTEVWQKERSLLDILGVQWIHSDARLDLRDLKLVDREADSFLYENEAVLPKIAGYYFWKIESESKERLRRLKSGEWDALHTVIVQNDTGFPPNAGLKNLPFTAAQILSDSDTRIYAKIDMQHDGVVETHLAAYPGWSLLIDGKASRWFTVNHAFIGFPATKGPHTLALAYQPTHWGLVKNLTTVSWIFVLALIAVSILI